jgi:hypothetical protein
MKPERSIVIVRLTTSVFKRGERHVYEKSISQLKSKSTMSVDEIMCDYQIDLPELLNSNQQPDGLYELTIINESRDWETGVVDDWELTLTPWSDKR